MSIILVLLIIPLVATTTIVIPSSGIALKKESDPILGELLTFDNFISITSSTVQGARKRYNSSLEPLGPTLE